ncbi:MAG TPA: hypothetical protein VGC96_12795 [Candidatus Elarobacter sp.]|jgi:hypothetical protein
MDFQTAESRTRLEVGESRLLGVIRPLSAAVVVNLLAPRLIRFN